MMDYEQICDLHYKNNLSNAQMSDYLSGGFDFIVKTVDIKENNTTIEEINNIKDEIYKSFMITDLFSNSPCKLNLLNFKYFCKRVDKFIPGLRGLYLFYDSLSKHLWKIMT